ncbi:flagellar biosynthetic protein FliR [Dongia mobilis]|uniref:Flagellar biosynthetic protein FliR n=1 Tax=Dongia mobilis TaxID=578943 RepID=A0A4R6WS12_9PROT|nr:flagellar biosynthetic protein FliR [Dongia mobilis]TDQ84402.1 flagellar biosynthetic protein FliR [Dongia mobilis]
MSITEFLTASVFQYFLVFARVGGAIAFLPGFGEGYVAVRARLVFALFFTLVLFPMLRDSVPPTPTHPTALGLLVLGEVTIGVFFGLICRVLLMAALAAGMVIALQIGIANAFTNDPTTAQQGAVTGNFLVAAAVVLIFATGLDHVTLRALVGTYGVFPVGEMPNLGDMADMFTRIAGDSFLLALQMTAPFLVYGLIVQVGMGLLARLMPTLQVFFVIMPLQLLVGFGLMSVTVSASLIWLLNVYQDRLSPFLN